MNTNEYLICRKCGMKLERGTLYCSGCGTPVESYHSEGTNLCTILSVIVLILGLIGSFYSAYKFGVNISFQEEEFSFTSERDMGATIVLLSFGMLTTLIIYSILATLGDIKAKLNGTEQSVGKPINEVSTNRVPQDGTWRCPECGQEHPMYVGVCHCGMPRVVKSRSSR